MNGNRNTVSCSAFLSRLTRLCVLAVAGLFAATATADPYLTFSSAQSFTITPPSKTWAGTIEYSTDATSWTVFTATGAAAADDGSGTHKLYLRGTGNTRISARGTSASAWTLTAAGAVACSGNAETLLDYTAVGNGQHPAMDDYCFAGLFEGWTALTDAPALPTTNLHYFCYRGMFQGCTGLTQAPALPATTVTDGCYLSMFAGCTGLTQAPELPATTMVGSCYQSMFAGCTGLTQAPELPATEVFWRCYKQMFAGCTGLTQAPALPATTAGAYCYDGMFAGCTGLTQAPSLPATTLDRFCYRFMFAGCTGLTQTPELPATELVQHCYANMFAGCTGLTQVPDLPATTLADFCYANMFAGCTGIKLSTQGPGAEWRIPVNAAAAMGWNTSMFAGTGGTFTGDPVIGVTYYYALPPRLTFSSAQSFTITPQTNSWDGVLQCSADGQNWEAFGTNGATAACLDGTHYRLYLRGTGNTRISAASWGAPGWTLTAAGTVACSGNIEALLDYRTVDAGQHPAMADYCFFNLFGGWTALAQAPALPATALTYACYNQMFADCTRLTQAPILPATTLADNCYAEMFRGCTGLTQAPTLSATTLAPFCYSYMFQGCTGLTQVPALPATTLVPFCYASMFADCTSIRLGTQGPGVVWGIPAGAAAATDWNAGMFAGTGGTFTGDPAIGVTYYYVLPPHLTFSSVDTFTITPQTNSWDGELQYSIDATTWETFDTDGATAAVDGSGMYRLYFRGTNNTRISADRWDMPGWTLTAAETVTCSGNIEALLDHAKVASGQHPAMARYCFLNLFKGWTELIQAPALSATTLAPYCYTSMFAGCTRLTQAPELPAKTLATSCYSQMFLGCTGLARAPALPATRLVFGCYANMFAGCTGLTQAPELPATTLGGACYQGMFAGCTGLTQAPELPATTLGGTCYQGMFSGCTGLTQAPALPATTLADTCYYYMFAGCTGLTQAPALPATTLAEYCYVGMFSGCTGLTQAPALPATTLAEYCYVSMFSGCTGIKLHTTGSAPTWGIPAGAATAVSWNTGMLAGTGGTFTGDPEIGVIYYYTPEGGTGPDDPDPPDPDVNPDAPIFAMDGTGIVVDPGTSTLAIKIINAKTGAWYTLLVADELGQPWAVSPAVQAQADGILVFPGVDATRSRRFYKVRASATQPQP